MAARVSAILSGFFRTRDELSLRNIRGRLWPVLLIFPLTIIMGDLRYFDLHLTALGLESYELMLFPLGIGWLVLARTPKRLLIPLLRVAAIISAVLLPLQIFSPDGMGRLALFMAFQFCSGVSAACAFSLFCFELNNVERLFGMAFAQFYFGFYYTVWRAFPAVQRAGKTWAGAVVMAVYLIVVFACARRNHEGLEDTESDGKGSAVPVAIGLNLVYYIIMCMINYVEGAEHSVSSLVFGLGAFMSVVLVVIIQLLNNRNALYIWLMFLALSLLGLGALLYDSPVTYISGSFAFGLGEGLGYIIIYYICAAAIKRSASYKMFRLYCFGFFVMNFITSGTFSFLFKYFKAPNKILAFSIVLVLGSFCLILMPLIQKKLFEADWTDGLRLSDIPEYSPSLSAAEVNVEAIDSGGSLNLTSREREIFAMLLAGTTPKEIAFALKVSYDTVRFHQKNLYRKLGVQNRVDLVVKYSSGGNAAIHRLDD